MILLRKLGGPGVERKAMMSVCKQQRRSEPAEEERGDEVLTPIVHTPPSPSPVGWEEEGIVG